MSLFENKDIFEKMYPTVTIIIPTFNREKYIGSVVRSVLNQTFQNFEIIIVDDGSSDGTRAIIEEFYSDKIIYVYQENKGRSHARNLALEMARGEYIAFLDSDDIYLPRKLELQVNFLDVNQDFSMLYTAAACIDGEGNFLPDAYDANISGWIYREIAFFVPITITLPTVMVRREVFDRVGRFDEALDRFEDTDMWRRISKHFQIFGLPERTCLLRTHSDNSLAAQDPLSITKALDHYVKKINREDKDMGWILRRRGIAKLYGYYGAAMMTNPKWHDIGHRLLVKEIRSWPFDARVTVRTISMLLTHSLKKLIQFTSSESARS